MSKPDLIALQARLLLLEEESVHFARVAEENARLKKTVARLNFDKVKLRAEVERLKARVEALESNPLPCPFHSDGKHRCIGCGDIHT